MTCFHNVGIAELGIQETVEAMANDLENILSAVRRNDAVPDLLEALKRLVAEAKLDGMESRAGWDCWISMAELAIAKAERIPNAGGSHVTPVRNAHPQPSAVEPVSSSTDNFYPEDAGSGA